MAKKDSPNQSRCDFCGRALPEDQLIHGLGAAICTDCVDAVNEVMAEVREREQKKAKNFALKLLKPHEIKAKLDE